MSWQATAWVSNVEAGGPSGKLLLYALANYADENGRCWPSDARLMADTEMAERTIRDWKRKLEDAGLITVERRRNAAGTWSADEIRLEMAGKKAPVSCVSPPANAAGGGDSTTGISRPDHRQMTAEPPASDSNPPTPPYKAEPSEEPPIEPIERESASARDREKSVEKWLKQNHPRWPSFVSDSGGAALRAALDITDDERAAAADRMADYLAAEKGHGRCAFSTYLGEKRWERLPPKSTEVQPVEAAPFGKMWGCLRLARLLAGAGPIPAATGFVATIIGRGGEAAEREMSARRKKYGYPAVNRMDELAAIGRGHIVRPADSRLAGIAATFEQVRVASDIWQAWKRLHEERDWPWLPDPGKQEWVYFPAGGPDKLPDFMQAIRGENDAGQPQAAE